MAVAQLDNDIKITSTGDIAPSQIRSIRWTNSSPSFIHELGTSPVVNVPTMTDRHYEVDVNLGRFVGMPATDQTRAQIDDTITSTLDWVGSQGASTGTITLRTDDSAGISATSSFLSSPHVYTTNGQVYVTSVSDSSVTFSYVTEPSKDQMIKDALRSQMKSNLLIKKATPRAVRARLHPGEEKARKTLRDLVSERAYRRYLTNGFIMVQASSGLYYQIFCDSRHTKIWQRNKVVGEICINTDGKCPPTDHVINLKMMLELDEVAVWKGGNLKQFDADFQTPFNLDKHISYRRVRENHNQGSNVHQLKQKGNANLVALKQELEKKYA